MDEQRSKDFVLSQIRAGITPQEITQQLQTAGWSQDAIDAAFQAAQAELQSVDASSTKAEGASAVQLPEPSGRGRFGVGLKLFMQSMRIIKNYPGLVYYVAISMVFTALVAVAYIAILISDVIFNTHVFTTMAAETAHGAKSDDLQLTGIGVLLTVFVVYATTVISLYYGVALSSHVLAIFRGTPGERRDHIRAARGKFTNILTFAVITIIVGYILQIIGERLKFVGRIISRILGMGWSLATTFVVPVLADSNDDAVKAVTDSAKLFKQTWGETITGRVAVSGAVFLVYLCVGVPLFLVLLVVFSAVGSIVGVVIAVLLLFFGILAVIVIGQLADNIVMVSLYYYAKHKTIPPSFSPELLGDVFTSKKSKNK